MMCNDIASPEVPSLMMEFLIGDYITSKVMFLIYIYVKKNKKKL